MPNEILDRAGLARTFPAGGAGAELGVLHGHHARSLYDNARPSLLYLIDRWTLNSQDDWPIGYDWERVLGEAKSQFRNGEDVEFVVSDSVAWMRTMPDDSLDWIYIDADHDYTSVIAEIHEARRIIKPGGIIAGHDYTTDPIDDQGNAYPCGVVQAVAEATALGYGRLMAVTLEQTPSWAIRTAPKDTNPDCHCELAGYCTRHKVKKATRLIELCKQRGEYWEAWEEERGPGQNQPAMRQEPQEGPAYNHWAALHYYPVKRQDNWNETQAKRFYRSWVQAIPNSQGCACRQKWKKLDTPIHFHSPAAFFESANCGHNQVNQSLGKPILSLSEARSIWWPEDKITMKPQG